VCPGPYNGDYYTTGGCYVGIAPSPTSKDAWEPFEATFTTAVDIVTVYINQESTTYSSIVNAVRIFLLQERFQKRASCPLCSHCIVDRLGADEQMLTLHNRTLHTPQLGHSKCFPAPENVTFAFLAYNDREEAFYKQTLNALAA
jgi:hypothetical protein